MVKNEMVIRSSQDPISPAGGLKILFGSLAPDGAVVKCAAVPKDMWKHTGPARVFDGEQLAMKAILAREINEGDVIIIRYEGPRGAPGMPEMLSPTSALMGLGYTSVVLITDGRFSGVHGDPASGMLLLRQRLEARLHWFSKKIRSKIDLFRKKIDILVDAKTLEQRKKTWKPHKNHFRDAGPVCKNRRAGKSRGGAKISRLIFALSKCSISSRNFNRDFTPGTSASPKIQ